MNDIYQKEDVLPYMRGMWREALQSVCGLDSSVFNKKHQPCPHCGGKDRFRWTDKLETSGDGGAVCNGCGNDKGIGWLMKFTGESYSECVNILGRFLGKVPQDYIVKANAKAKRDTGFNFGARMDHEKAAEIMSRTVEMDVTNLSIWEAVESPEPFRVGIGEEDGRQTHAAPCHIVYEDGLEEDEICNILLIDDESKARFAARKMTIGSAIRIGKSDKAIYLVTDWLEGLRVNMATGQEVWVCFTAPNIEIVAFRYKGVRELRVACSTSDRDSICSAEERGLKVIIPLSGKSFRSGAQKRLYNPSDLLEI
jgi:phage/plasmid primase-like uncharacterized protein